MRSRSIIVMILLLTAALICTRLAKIYRWGAVDDAPGREVSLFQLEKGDITVLRIKKGNTDLTFRKKDDDTWFIEGPVKDKADGDAVEGVLEKIRAMTWSRRMVSNPVKPLDLEALGLDPPRVTVSFTVPSGEALLLVGVYAPMSDLVYVAANDTKTVYLVDGSIMPRLENELEDFRDRSVLSFDLALVTGLKIQRPDGVISFSKNAHGWDMLEPVNDDARKQVIGGILAFLSKILVIDFVDDAPSDIGVYGLKEPFFTVEIAGIDRERQTLLVGAGVEGEKAVYAKRGTGNYIYTLDNEISDLLSLEVKSFRNDHVLTFWPDEVKKIELALEDHNVVVEKVEESWRMTEPACLMGDTYAIEHVIADLCSLEIKQFAADSARGLAKYGLKKTKPLASVTLIDGRILGVRVGDMAGEGVGCYIMRDGSPHVYTVDGHVHHLTDMTAGDLVYKRLAEFDLEDVMSLSIIRPEEELVMTKLGGKWNITSPERLECDVATLNAALLAMSQMKAQSVAVFDVPDYHSYNLEPARFYVTASTTQGKQTILIGKSAAEGYYVKLPDESCVYVVDADHVDHLDKRFSDMKRSSADASEKSR